jgi:phosphonate transport system permease protein
MLQVRGLTMRYPNGKLALVDFDLSIEAGEVVVVLGGNGSGKTTLLRCISRTLCPTAGEIWLNDTNLAALSGERLRQARLPLAMIWQHASLVRRRSVLSNVASGALGRYGGLWTALGGLPAVECDAAYDYLNAVGLAALAGQRAGTLSGGQAQRVAIARALAQRPQVLLADEPRPRSSRRHHAPGAPPCDARAPRRVVRIAPGRAGLWLCRPRRRHSRRQDRFRSVVCRAAARCGASALSRRGRLYLEAAGPQLVERSWTEALGLALRLVLVLALVAIVVQAAIVVRARPQDLITGAYGMADIVRRAMPPDFSKIDMVWWPALETIDLGIFGTLGGVIMALPLAILAATNVTPSRYLYYAARGVIGFARAVPDLVWALLFVTAVGLGPFPGALALSVHSIGMLGRLFAETIEHMDMAPIDALTLTGARRVQVFTHGIIPSILPSLLGIALYRLDENIRSSLVLGFVGAGGIGFELLSAMSLFQYQLVSLLLIVTFVIVIAAERLSALLRARLG